MPFVAIQSPGRNLLLVSIWSYFSFRDREKVNLAITKLNEIRFYILSKKVSPLAEFPFSQDWIAGGWRGFSLWHQQNERLFTKIKLKITFLPSRPTRTMLHTRNTGKSGGRFKVYWSERLQWVSEGRLRRTGKIYGIVSLMLLFFWAFRSAFNFINKSFSSSVSFDSFCRMLSKRCFWNKQTNRIRMRMFARLIKILLPSLILLWASGWWFRWSAAECFVSSIQWSKLSLKFQVDM